MIKRLIIAIVLLTLVIGGIVGFNQFRAKMIAQYLDSMKNVTVPVTVTEAQSGTWTPGIDAIGTANARQGADLSTEASGVVREILFQSNDTVTSSQLLVQIDDRQERADLEAAKASLNLAQITLNRARNLQERGVTATSTLDSAQAEEVSAQAQVAKLEAVLQTKQLLAPFDGTIGIPRIEVGQFVAAGTVFATLQDRSQMRVDFALTEQQAAQVRQGYSVTAIDEEGGTSFEGEITGIDPKIDANSRLVTVRALLDEASGEALTPGQFLRVRVNLPAVENVISLPQTVVTTSLYGDSVFVVREETPEGADAPQTIAREVFVRIGRRHGNSVEILEGLKAGDRVVDAGQNRLSSGAVVRIVTDPAETGDAPPVIGN
ncbi:efflux RND transporter periplasmic adaptor subunit [Sinirhodobacter populi]|uniref:Efflux RND transporter periplasmic adaptor subunit n=1 Tax=Paenirhodobacter populi TaxID=2306993 RepID=A0A443KJN2_9RHOB|nr:efflux RND transporter periplasmic adaptor subunit [Sinirhodobacter populi]RWR09948.1 efflux RND transporter periplasmic adaptor subunit [Sinirhodobacter populi]RWR32982.1 efflux RND transporter periplasmic adaptor subunit [Sinirhodobacter populi]